jgi:PKD repeat protein
MNNNTNYKFTVKNKVGEGELVPNEDRLIENIIYSNSGYKITVKIDGNYTQSFRKEVLWDFGDGEKVKGGQVEHYYKRPGRYTITATLFDDKRKGYL